MARRSHKRDLFEDIPPAGGVILAVRPAARREDCVTLKIGRKQTPPMLAQDALVAGLLLGVEWDENRREQAAGAVLHCRLRVYALSVAGRRALSKRQMEQRLTRNGASRSLATSIVLWLESLGVIDEAKLADTLAIRQVSGKPAGKSLFSSKLRSKGIDQKMADSAVNSAIRDAEYDVDAGAMAFAERKARSLLRLGDPEKARKRLYAALARRGFDPGLCARATKHALGGSVDPSA